MGRCQATLAGGCCCSLLLIPALVAASASPQSSSYDVDPPVQEGLVLDGRPVTNVFPYGPDGEPLDGVTLLDQDGRPIDVSAEEEWDGQSGKVTAQVPRITEDGVPRWNVVPQRRLTLPVDEAEALRDVRTGRILAPSATASPAAPPVLRVPAAVEPTPTATPRSR